MKIEQINLYPNRQEDESEETLGIVRIARIEIIYENDFEEIDDNVLGDYQFIEDDDSSYQQMKNEIAQRYGVNPSQVKFIND